MSNERRSKWSINNEMSKEIQGEVYWRCVYMLKVVTFITSFHIYFVATRFETKRNWCLPTPHHIFFCILHVYADAMTQNKTKTKMKLTFCRSKQEWNFLVCISYQENIFTWIKCEIFNGFVWRCKECRKCFVITLQPSSYNYFFPWIFSHFNFFTVIF